MKTENEMDKFKDNLGYVCATTVVISLPIVLISAILMIWFGGVIWFKILATSAMFLFLALAFGTSINDTKK